MGEIVTGAGGVQLMLRENSERLLSVNQLLSDETLALFPRLLLVRIVAQVYKGEVEDGGRQFAEVEPELRAAAVNDLQLECDLNLVEAILAHNGSEPVDSPRQRRVFEVSERLAREPDVDSVVRGDMELGMCYLHNLKAEFGPALERVRRARCSLGDESPYLQMVADFWCGQVAMAQGRVQEAAAWYRKGMTTSRDQFLINPRVGALAIVLTEELDFERNRADHLKPIPLARASGDPASAEMAVERARETRGTDYAVRVAEASWAGARRAGLPRLERSLAGLFIATLATAGRVEEADAHWRDQALPQSPEGCVDLAGQSWREMEVVSSARLRLCTAQGDFEAGRRLVTELLAVTRQRGLRRTEMRALGQAMAHEHAAGRPDLALEHLAAFLRLFAKTDYARPIVRERVSAVPVLTEFLETGPDLQLEDLAADLLMAARMADSDAIPKLTAREFEVLRRLETRTDRQIAVELGLTRDGVRYHVRHLFEKLRVRGRKAAGERARSVGIL
ncbi:MAG: LuxR C-terminal-related transcriptional regulator [Gammaproteobacteria bacterium]|nr:LuxR C-terminal-related transcriptional regulator [Gammaproteobacteria bacterium]